MIYIMLNVYIFNSFKEALAINRMAYFFLNTNRIW